jgi:hypothetical protein
MLQLVEEVVVVHKVAAEVLANSSVELHLSADLLQYLLL